MVIKKDALACNERSYERVPYDPMCVLSPSLSSNTSTAIHIAGIVADMLLESM